MIWTRAARADLEQIVEHASLESPTGALHVFNALMAAAASLSEFAERGRRMPEIGRVDVREVFVFNYRLVYQVSGEAVYILGAVHGARDVRGMRWPRSADV